MTRTLLKRLAAGAGAFALATAGLMGVGTAHAAPPSHSDANIQSGDTGDLTIHKSAAVPTDPNDGQPVDPAPSPGLEGVQFTIHRVGHASGAIDLSTAAGWELAQDAYAADVTGVPWTLTLVDSDVTNPTGDVTFADLAIGLYRVTETDSGDNLIKTPAAPFLVTVPMPNSNGTWNFDVHAYPKNVLQEIEPTKVADDPSKDVWVTGTTVDWTITVPVPRSPLPYKSFEISDAVGTGLTFTDWLSISIGDEDLVAADYDIDGSTIVLTPAGVGKLNVAQAATDGVDVVAKIRTTVAENPGGQLENTATIKVNGQPFDANGTTNWGKLRVTKTSDGTETTLADAAFDVYDGKEGTLIGTGTTGDDGTVTFDIFVGNDEVVQRADIWLKETVAPAGHVLPADPWFGPYEINESATTSTSVTIENHRPAGPLLPSTGAAGTLAFSIFGLGLIGAAAAMGMRRKARATN